MKATASAIVCLLLALSVGTVAGAAPDTSWRYYRVGNTGIQGDFNEALWLDADGNPYIGGYDANFEEGGFAQFLVGENRWVNYSNVDHAVLGHPEQTGTIRVNEIEPDQDGRLWLGTWLGAIRFDPALGASSLVRFDAGNSQLNGGYIYDIAGAPDGSVWFANDGIVRFDPVSGDWTRWDLGNRFVAPQPKPGGGYLVWSSGSPQIPDGTWTFDSDTQQWTVQLPTGAPGEVVGLPGRRCVDDAGNLWALRSGQPGDYPSLEYRRPDGTWVAALLPFPSQAFDIWAFTAHADGKALLVDGSGEVLHFDGTQWASLGVWRAGPASADVGMDAAGNVWVCGVGGAARRDAQTGIWQRYRITNTGNFDNFNGDLAIDGTGDVYVGANAAAGVGGMARFDGKRWTGWNGLTHGLGYAWPFPNDNCHAVSYRPSSGQVAVAPTNWIYGLHAWNGAGFTELTADGGAQRLCEDSLGRLWAMGEYYNLRVQDGAAWTQLPIISWGQQVLPDPSRSGTVWALTDHEFQRVDGLGYTVSRTIADFPELTPTSDHFAGIVPDADGIAWIGCTVNFGGIDGAGGLIRYDGNTETYQKLRYTEGWPFPGQYVSPVATTPDGRLWLAYDTDYPHPERGLCWWDGTQVGVFPAPTGGEPQWGGLPHVQIADAEVRVIPGGYELWLSCVSRGLAVLTVLNDTNSDVARDELPSPFGLRPNHPNPFNPQTTVAFSLPREESVRLAVHTLAGARVAVLADRVFAAGEHTLQWDGRDDQGRALPSGQYLLHLDSPSLRQSRKMTLLR
jgi:streptogramin lyase